MAPWDYICSNIPLSPPFRPAAAVAPSTPPGSPASAISELTPIPSPTDVTTSLATTFIGAPTIDDTLRWFQCLHSWHTRVRVEKPNDEQQADYKRQEQEVEACVQQIKSHWAALDHPLYERVTPWNPNAAPALDLLCTQPWTALFKDDAEAIGRSYSVEHLPRYMMYVETVVELWSKYFGCPDTLPTQWTKMKTDLSGLFADAPRPLPLDNIKTAKTGKAKNEDNIPEVRTATYIPPRDAFDEAFDDERERREDFREGLIERILFALLLPPPSELDDEHTLTVRVLPTPAMLPAWWTHTKHFRPVVNEVCSPVMHRGCAALMFSSDASLAR